MKNLLNEQRKLLHGVILELFAAGEKGQLILLQQACHLSLRTLDPMANIDRLQEELEVLKSETKSGPKINL